MASSKVKLKIREPILYSFLKNKVFGLNKISQIKELFEKNYDRRQDLYDDIQNLFSEDEIPNISTYLQNIQEYEKKLNILFRYYQFLALLFTEYFLDNYFQDKDLLLGQINDFVENFYLENFVS
jgi:hypothetical protein